MIPPHPDCAQKKLSASSLDEVAQAQQQAQQARDSLQAASAAAGASRAEVRLKAAELPLHLPILASQSPPWYMDSAVAGCIHNLKKLLAMQTRCAGRQGAVERTGAGERVGAAQGHGCAQAGSLRAVEVAASLAYHRNPP